MFVELIATLIDLARERTRTVEGRRLLAGIRVARNGTRSRPETVAVAGCFGSVVGVTENGDFVTEETLEALGEQLDQLAERCPGEVLVFRDAPHFDDATGQFNV